MAKRLTLPTRYGKTLIPDLTIGGDRPWRRRHAGRRAVSLPIATIDEA